MLSLLPFLNSFSSSTCFLLTVCLSIILSISRKFSWPHWNLSCKLCWPLLLLSFTRVCRYVEIHQPMGMEILLKIHCFRWMIHLITNVRNKGTYMNSCGWRVQLSQSRVIAIQYVLEQSLVTCLKDPGTTDNIRAWRQRGQEAEGQSLCPFLRVWIFKRWYRKQGYEL
jgi:hypothetical protein